MESPKTTDHESIRDEQGKLFKLIRPLGPEDVVRGQFRGYRQEKGVARDSKVETFAAARLHIDSPRLGRSAGLYSCGQVPANNDDRSAGNAQTTRSQQDLLRPS